MAARNPPASAAPEAATPPPAAGKSSKVLVIALAAFGFIGGIGGAGTGWWLYSQSRHSAEESHDEKPAKGEKSEKGEKSAKSEKGKDAKEHKPPVFVPMDNFTVNLRPGQGRDHYLQIGLVIEASDEHAGDAAKAQMPVIRSQILLLLASQTPEDINTPEGKEKLAAALLAKVKQPVADSQPIEGIEHVHFSSFIIQ